MGHCEHVSAVLLGHAPIWVLTPPTCLGIRCFYLDCRNIFYSSDILFALSVSVTLSTFKNEFTRSLSAHRCAKCAQTAPGSLVGVIFFSSFLTVSGLREVHISVSEGSPGDHVAAHPNGEHRSGWAELLVQHCLRDIGVQVANVEGSHRITPGRCVHISGFTTGMRSRFHSKRQKKKYV